MKRISPGSMTGPRAYFTAFDPQIVSRSRNREELTRTCERRLKMLLLLKSRVVCAASHMKSPIAESVFRSNPFLLELGLVIPALRDTADSIRGAFEASTESPQSCEPHLASYYDDIVSAVVIWNVEETSASFRQQFFAELTNPQSVVRMNARGVSDTAVAELAERCTGHTHFDRLAVESWAAPLNHGDREVVLAFRELIYHFAGARVVHCESSLPQEEYLDFDLADMSQQRTRLSDHTIFWKLFVEHAFASLQMRAVPVELLDLLEYRDIALIREPLLQIGFQEKYDELVQMAIDTARGPAPPLLENLERLEQIRATLDATFTAVFDEELPKCLRRRAPAIQHALASNGVSFGLGLAGLVPGLGSVVSAGGLLKDSIALCFNLAHLHPSSAPILDAARRREQAIRDLCLRLPAEDAPMLDMVALLSSVIQERARWPLTSPY